jgi:hypothetical protein
MLPEVHRLMFFLIENHIYWSCCWLFHNVIKCNKFHAFKSKCRIYREMRATTYKLSIYRSLKTLGSYDERRELRLGFDNLKDLPRSTGAVVT